MLTSEQLEAAFDDAVRSFVEKQDIEHLGTMIQGAIFTWNNGSSQMTPFSFHDDSTRRQVVKFVREQHTSALGVAFSIKYIHYTYDDKDKTEQTEGSNVIVLPFNVDTHRKLLKAKGGEAFNKSIDVKSTVEDIISNGGNTKPPRGKNSRGSIIGEDNEPPPTDKHNT